MKNEILKLRDQFRDWYASISVTEIVFNEDLVLRIEKLEHRLSSIVY
jgi:hypothetical protein